MRPQREPDRVKTECKHRHRRHSNKPDSWNDAQEREHSGHATQDPKNICRDFCDTRRWISKERNPFLSSGKPDKESREEANHTDDPTEIIKLRHGRHVTAARPGGQARIAGSSVRKQTAVGEVRRESGRCAALRTLRVEQASRLFGIEGTAGETGETPV